MVNENRDRLERPAKELRERETVDEADAYAVAGFEARPEEERRRAERPVAVARQAPDDPSPR